MSMMDKMRQAKELYALQKKAKSIQKELKEYQIRAESLGGKVAVIFSGEQKIEKVEIDPEVMKTESAEKLASAIKEAVKEALKEAQKIAAGKSKEMMGDLGLPGM